MNRLLHTQYRLKLKIKGKIKLGGHKTDKVKTKKTENQSKDITIQPKRVKKQLANIHT